MAKRGQKPKPTALHKLHATMDSEVRNARKYEPIAAGNIGDPPPHLSEDQKADWIYAVRNAPDNVMGAIDRWALEVFVVAADHHRIANREQQKLDAGNALPLLRQTSETVIRKGKKVAGGNLVQSPYLAIMSTVGKRMLAAAAELGFTPASRPRLENQQFDPAPTANRGASAATLNPSPATRDERALDSLMARKNKAIN